MTTRRHRATRRHHLPAPLLPRHENPRRGTSSYPSQHHRVGYYALACTARYDVRIMTTTVYPGAAHKSNPPGTQVSPLFPGTKAPGTQPAPRSTLPSRWLIAAAVVVVTAGILLRFWTRSDLWLDEAQTLSIARLPVSRIGSALRQDGAPPLYYLLLHWWTGLFGTSTFAVRALPGLLGTGNLPLAWLAGRRLGGDRVASASLLLTASSPFAIWYSTDNRMYALVMVEVLAGGLLLASALAHPRWWNLAGVALCAGAVLYTHYWALFLLPVLLAGLVWIAWRSSHSGPALLAAGAVGLGCLSFLPWLPSFLFQLHHTGTPWTTPVGLSMLPDTVLQFSGGSTNAGVCLEAILGFLALAGLAGVATGAGRIELDLRARPRGRWLAGLVAGTLLTAVIGGTLAGTGFQDRYAAVVFPPFALLCAYGTVSLSPSWLRRVILAVAVVLGLVGAIPNVTADRTQATQVAAAIRSQSHPGDVVGYCPDQLGPDAARLLPGSLRLTQLTFPRYGSPQRVDWVNYLSAVHHSDPAAFAERLLADAGATHTVWFVWQTGYRGFGDDCRKIADALMAARPDLVRRVSPQWPAFMEPSRLTIFRPLTPSGLSR